MIKSKQENTIVLFLNCGTLPSMKLSGACAKKHLFILKLFSGLINAMNSSKASKPKKLNTSVNMFTLCHINGL